MAATMSRTMTTTLAAEAMGVTPRVLDYWSRTGVLAADQEASGSGSRRQWSADSVTIGRALGVLACLGAQGDVLTVAAQGLRERLDAGEWEGRVVVDPLGRLAGVFDLVASGWFLDLNALGR